MPEENYVLNQQVSFIQHFLPGLEAGEYKLQVDQQVFQKDGKTPVSGKAYTNAYTFAVTGDRFGLAKPGEIVASIFPADNASGEYTNVLPHVVFSKTTFPWTRYPTLKPPYAPPPPGKDVDANVPTWLWVMVLDEDDVTEYASLKLNPFTCTIGDLYPQKVYPDSKLPDTDASYFYKADSLAGLEPGQTTKDSIQAIDIPLDLFWKIAPTVDDMYQLAHGRVVSLVNQCMLGTDDIGEPTGSFSIVFGNRLPANKKKTYAYLVSLEELEEFLPKVGGIPPESKAYPPGANLRLAVLKSWTFFSTGQSAAFVHKLESLNGCTPGGPPAENTSVRLEYKGQNKVIGDIFQMGFLPLNETMRTAEKNVSWYRGPLLPYSIPDRNIEFPIPSPDGATFFDPTTGMLDASYAAAWTIGRMVGLQDVSFSTGLYTWKKGLSQEVVNSIENKLIDEEFSAALTRPGTLRKMPLTAGSLFKQTVLMLNKE
jgi:hypothetical protein